MPSPADPDPLAASSAHDDANDVDLPGADPTDAVESAASPAESCEGSGPTDEPRLHWWRRSSDALNRNALLRELVIGLMVGAILVGVAVWFDQRNANRAETIATNQFNEANRLAAEQNDRAEVLENTRFVRQAAMTDARVLPFQGLNLVGAELSGLPLGCGPETDTESEAETEARRLKCANFSDANLRGANLTRADLTGAILTGADLTGAILTAANLTFATLDGADLDGANLATAYLPDANFSHANLRGAILTPAILTRANLSGADLDGADLDGADLDGADLAFASLNSAYLGGADLGGADLTGADLSSANLTVICFDDRTIWPAGFTPLLPANCPRTVTGEGPSEWGNR